ncbi:hypothetical protein HHX47_DHR5000848 [Lentinula edodes]|nr:hypothetical protein HHX47_DHR5000848 [Lentinula edodes]
MDLTVMHGCLRTTRIWLPAHVLSTQSPSAVGKAGTELLVRYFVGTELGVVNLLQKNFDWSSNSLWYEEIPNARDPSKTLFLLGDKDTIIAPSRVKLYLRSHGVRKGLWCDPNGRHGQALLAGGEGCKVVYEWLKEREC